MKKNFIYILIGLVISALTISLTFLAPISGYILEGCDTSCRIDPNFIVDITNCRLSFYDVWKNEECDGGAFMFSQDGGSNWINGVLPAESIRIDGDNCNIQIKADATSRSYKFKNNIKCNCGPCKPSKSNERKKLEIFIENPSDEYLPFDNCCCRDYNFSINNDLIPSILISLRLHADYLNNIRYSISKIDDEKKIIYLSHP